MATTLSAPISTAAPATDQRTPAARKPSSERLTSLDVFRGLTMLLLISHGFGVHEATQAGAGKGSELWAKFAYQFDHVAWTGCTVWDLIQPAFTFIVGTAMALSLSRRLKEGASRLSLFAHVAWRAAVLIVLSNVLSNWNTRGPLKFQLINVLCQIAISYVVCFAIWNLPFVWQVVAAAAMMIGHHALFYLYPGPGGAFDMANNIGAAIDLKVLGYTYSGYYTTINFMGNAITVLFGVWAGMFLQQPRSHAERLKVFGACAAAAFALGLTLETWIPMVKRLWLGSFTFFSTGWVLVGLMACYWIVEMKGWKRWAFPAIVVGTNCIFIYSFSQVLRGWLERGVANFTGKFAFLGPWGMIPQNLVVMGIMFYLCYWLYQRKLFFKI